MDGDVFFGDMGAKEAKRVSLPSLPILRELRGWLAESFATRLPHLSSTLVRSSSTPRMTFTTVRCPSLSPSFFPYELLIFSFDSRSHSPLYVSLPRP